MNIVQQIMDQLFAAGLGKLSALLGVRDEKTESVVGAAVPALLSGLANLASTGEGAQKLAAALGKFDAGSLTNLANLLSGNAGALVEQGTALLGPLFSGNALSSIIGPVSRFAGLDESTAKSLLGYISPLVLGTIAKQFVGKTINAQGLSNFFATQKSNITNALPSGLSLTDVPGPAHVSPAARPDYETGRPQYEAREAGRAARPAYDTESRREPASSSLKWLLPLLALVALPFLLYLLWTKSKPAPEVATPKPVPQVTAPKPAAPEVATPRPAAPDVAVPSPVVPDIATVTRDLTGDFSLLSNTLNSVKDAASAEAAVPRLSELSNKLAGMKALVDRLPDSARTKVSELIQSSMAKLGDQFNRVLMIPGVADRLRPALEGIGTRVASLAGLPASRFALPSVEVTQTGSQLTEMMSSLTETLTGVHDVASAEAALPKLREINDRLDVIRGAWNKLPESGKTAISSMLMTAIASVKPHVNDTMRLAGVSERIRPVVDQIMTKLDQLAG